MGARRADTIFVMEDVDAASKVVQRRKPQALTTTTTTKVVRAPADDDGLIAPHRAKTVGASPNAGSGKSLLPALPSKRPAAKPDAKPDAKAEGGEPREAEAEETVVEESVVTVVQGDAGPAKKSDWLKESAIEADRLDLAGLLNVLDGVVDSPNRIVIMTTNHPEKLDPALIRPGRINKQILMGYLLAPQALSMVEHYFGATSAAFQDRFYEAFTSNVFTPAQVEQLCAEHDTVEQFLVGLHTLAPNAY